MSIMEGDLDLYPGDRIKFLNSEGIESWDHINEAKFVEIPKKGDGKTFGKVWTFITVGGESVPFTRVIETEKLPRKSPIPEKETFIYGDEPSFSQVKILRRMLFEILRDLQVNDTVKAAVIFAIEDTPHTLSCARVMISQRAQQLIELEQASAGKKSTTPEMA